MKFVLKQNPDLDHNDIEEMMARALGNESSVVASCSLATTHLPNVDDDFIQTFINLKKIIY